MSTQGEVKPPGDQKQDRSVATIGVVAPVTSHDYPLGFDAVATAVGSLVALVFFLRKRYFRDNADISHSKGESHLVASLIQQAEAHKKDARDAWAQRTADAQTIARQAAQIQNLRQTLDIVISVLRDVAPDKAALFDKLPEFTKESYDSN